jgi:hypothetical protein
MKSRGSAAFIAISALVVLTIPPSTAQDDGVPVRVVLHTRSDEIIGSTGLTL